MIPFSLCELHQGGMPHLLCIKVDKMVPACCASFSGSIADTLFYKRLSFERGGLLPGQREENE
jgi:hypothetical protein